MRVRCAKASGHVCVRDSSSIIDYTLNQCNTHAGGARRSGRRALIELDVCARCAHVLVRQRNGF